MKKLILLFALARFAQAQLPVTATHIKDSFERPIATAKLCFVPVDAAMHPTGFRVGTTQVVPNEVCGNVTAGVLQTGLSVAPTPTGVFYHIYLKQSFANTVLRDYGMTAITSDWTLDTLDPNLAVLPVSAVTLGTVTTLAPGSPATCDISGASPYVLLNCGIPSGFTGAQGPIGGPTSGVNLTPPATQTVQQGLVSGKSTDLSISSTNGVLNALMFTGASPNDIGAKVNAAIAALPSGCGTVYIPVGNAYTWSTTIVLPRCVNLIGGGAVGTTLNWTPISGTALVAASAVGSDGEGGVHGYPMGHISDLTFIGPGNATTTTAVLIGADPTGVLTPNDWRGDHENLNRVRIRYFGTGMTWGNYAWSTTIHESIISDNGTGIYFPSGLIDSGESISLIGSRVANSSVQGLNLVGFADFYFYGFSCDYNLTCGTVNVAHFYGTHFEQGSGRMLTVAGAALPAVEVFGGEVIYTFPTGTNSNDIFYVNSANNPMFKISGTYIDIAPGHHLSFLVNWNGTGAFAQLDIEDIPYPGGQLLDMTNTTCKFIGCYIHDGSLGIFATNFNGGHVDTGGNASFATVNAGGAGTGITLNGAVTGFAEMQGNPQGVRIDPFSTDILHPVLITDNVVNAINQTIIGGLFQVGTNIGYTGTILAGACTIHFVGGIVTGVTGC
jgi:hypothetical protein